MNTDEKCCTCGSKTKMMSHCDVCGRLVCIDCADQRADIGADYICPACDRKNPYKG